MKPRGKTYVRCGFIAKNVEGGGLQPPPPPPGLYRVKFIVDCLTWHSRNHATFRVFLDGLVCYTNFQRNSSMKIIIHSFSATLGNIQGQNFYFSVFFTVFHQVALADCLMGDSVLEILVIFM